MTKLTTQNTPDDEKKGTDCTVSVLIEQTKPKSSPSKGNRRGKRPLTKQQRICLHIIIFILATAAIAMAILGSYYIYKSVHYKNYRGRCKISLKGNKAQQLQENVDLSSDHEMISVPKFDDNDEAVFLHDFKQEISVIKDITDKVCYLLPLNKDIIPPPRNFMDLLYGLQSDEYIYDADMVRSGYKVVYPEFDNEHLREEYGDYIADSCSEYNTYRLEETEKVMTTTTTESSYYIMRKFVMYPGGQSLIQYIIYK